MLIFQQHIIFFFIMVALISLCVGSFLNVVIYRLPIMLKNEWTANCHELLGSAPIQMERFNLLLPRSHCPNCKKMISAWSNIPIVSFILQKARCRYCHHPISWQYPGVELVTAMLSLMVVWRFGFNPITLFMLVLTWALIALSVIDLNEQLLPDIITIPSLWLGLFLSLFSFAQISSAGAIIGALVGYLSLWTLNTTFKMLTHKEGMGHGDFKLFAVFGAWLGWQPLLFIILLASLLGALVGIGLILFKKHEKNIPIPFGPFLAFAGWIALLWHKDIIAWYLGSIT